MNLIIYVNETFEEEKALYDLDEKKLIVMGDYYHDKIDHVIDGYLLAKEIGDDECVPEEFIGKHHPMFRELKFYDNDYEEVEDEWDGLCEDE